MESFYAFASESPWLTFFLAYIVLSATGNTIVGVAKAIRGIK